VKSSKDPEAAPGKDGWAHVKQALKIISKEMELK